MQASQASASPPNTFSRGNTDGGVYHHRNHLPLSPARLGRNAHGGLANLYRSPCSLEAYCSPIGIQDSHGFANHRHIGWAFWLISTPKTPISVFFSEALWQQVEKDGKGTKPRANLPPANGLDESSFTKASMIGEGSRKGLGKV